jgi:hypothetical protein
MEPLGVRPILIIWKCDKCEICSYKSPKLDTIVCPSYKHKLCGELYKGVEIITCGDCEVRDNEHYCPHPIHDVILNNEELYGEISEDEEELAQAGRCKHMRKYYYQLDSDDELFYH